MSQLSFSGVQNTKNVFLPFLLAFVGMVLAIPVSVAVSTTIVRAEVGALGSQVGYSQQAPAPLVSQASTATGSCTVPATENSQPVKKAVAPKVTQTSSYDAGSVPAGSHGYANTVGMHHHVAGISHSFNNTYNYSHVTKNTNTWNSHVTIDSYNTEDSYNTDVDVEVKDSFNKDSYNTKVDVDYTKVDVDNTYTKNETTHNTNSNNVGSFNSPVTSVVDTDTTTNNTSTTTTNLNSNNTVNSGNAVNNGNTVDSNNTQTGAFQVQI